jgi:hypothetical protein
VSSCRALIENQKTISRFNWGGIQYVTLSDDEAKRRNPKEYLKEKLTPFEIIIEINDQNSWTIHEDVEIQ